MSRSVVRTILGFCLVSLLVVGNVEGFAVLPSASFVSHAKRLGASDRWPCQHGSRTELSSTLRRNEPTPDIPSAVAVAVQDFFRELDELYNRSTSIRCPFWRRRTADLIDSAAMVMRFLLIRHKSLGILDPLWTLDDVDADGIAASSAALPPGCKAVGRHVKTNEDGTVLKCRVLALPAVAETIRGDWESGSGGSLDKGYYITGRLNSTVYTDDCLFDGPDPDMPVRGLRKYLSAASHLFDPKSSSARLLSLEWEEGGGKRGNGVVVARWGLSGTLMLPWRPAVKPWTGMTRYHLDDDMLVYLHEESWDISVWEAFICTVWPEVGERIWAKGERVPDV